MRKILVLVALHLLLSNSVALARRPEPGIDSSAMKNLTKRIVGSMDLQADPCKDLYQYACGRVRPSARSGRLSTNKLDLEWPLEQQRDSWPLLISYGNTDDDDGDNNGNQLEAYAGKSYEDVLANIEQLSITFSMSCQNHVSPSTRNFDFARAITKHLLFGSGPKPRDWIDSQTALSNFPVPREYSHKLAQRSVFFELTTHVDATRRSGVTILVDLKKQGSFSLPQNASDLAPNLGLTKGRYERLYRLSVELIKLHEKIANTSTRNDRNVAIKSVYDLQRLFPGVAWLRLITGFFGLDHLSNDQRIEFKQASGVKRMARFLEQYGSSADGKAALMDWVVYKTAMDNVGSPEEVDCGELTRRYFSPFFLSKIKRLDEVERKLVLDMVKDIVHAYDIMIEQTEWNITEQMRQVARQKLKKMRFHIGHSDRALDPQFLHKVYGGLELSKQNYTHNVRILDQIIRSHNANDLLLDYDADNAYHYHGDNFVFPTVRYISVRFSSKWPSFANFGRLGRVIAHEITHGFDRNGITDNGSGSTLFGVSGEQMHNERTECLVELYNNRPVPGTIRRSRGYQTINENIADSAIEAAYNAYRERARLLPEKEPKLSGLENLTTKKLFWISAANTFCRNLDQQSSNAQLISGPHSDDYLRVNIGMMMHPKFRTDFRCSVDVDTNDQCRLW